MDSPVQFPANVKENVKKTYDCIAADYNKWHVINKRMREDMLGELLKLLPNGQDRQVMVLELGCGAALTSLRTMLSRDGTNVIANDMYAAQLELAKENLSKFPEVAMSRVRFEEGDMMQLSFPSGSIDAVVGLYSLIHLPREEQSELLIRISDWLRPGGHILVNFMSHDEEVRVKNDWLPEKGWMFWSGWGAELTSELVEGAGFEILKADLRGDIRDAVFFWDERITCSVILRAWLRIRRQSLASLGS